MVSSNRRIQAARPATVLLVQQLLQLVGELVRPEGAQVAQPGPVARQRRVGQLRVERGVVEPVQLEREEQQLGRDRVDPLLHRLVEAADLRVGDIAGADAAGRSS